MLVAIAENVFLTNGHRLLVEGWCALKELTLLTNFSEAEYPSNFRICH
jgi:hypothetical protein